ncbi:MAG: hypothetical protein M1840_002870 [Geoglossum simile]|nr:MAG: hypothetical protein M1840_002870 [Geoglossum simile]
MQKVNPDAPPKPCDFFDLIGGTGTGGLIATLLGRLEMDIPSAIKAFRGFSTSVFQPTGDHGSSFRGDTYMGLTNGISDPQILADIIGEILRRSGETENATFRKTGQNPRCRVNKEAAQLVRLRSYLLNDADEVDSTIQAAVCATCAASPVFHPIHLGAVGEFDDNAPGLSNPTGEVISEARAIWPSADRRTQLVVSIGAGRPSLIAGAPMNDITQTTLRISADAEIMAEKLLIVHKHLQPGTNFFRFNGVSGMKDVNLYEYREGAKIITVTEADDASNTIAQTIKISASILPNPECSRIEQVITNNLENFGEYQKSIEKWLSPESSCSTLEYVLETPHEGTCTWILDERLYSDWVSSDNRGEMLWITGSPGCGKTVLAASIVRTLLMCRSATSHVAYVFCKKNSAHQTTTMVKSLIWQIVTRPDLIACQKELVINTYRACAGVVNNHEPEQGDETLIFWNLYAHLTSTYDEASLVVDGVDECDTPHEFLHHIFAIQDFKTGSSNRRRVLFISQDAPLVTQAFQEKENLKRLKISAQQVKRDISLFLKERLDNIEPQLGRSTKQEILYNLLKKSEGMFLWAGLGISVIEQCLQTYGETDPRFTEGINSLTTELGDLYVHLLDRIFSSAADCADRLSTATMIFRWTLWGQRPLTVMEFLALQSLQDRRSAEPRLGSERLKPLSAGYVEEFKAQIVSLCAPLIILQADGQVIPVHSTLKDYITEIQGGNVPACVKIIGDQPSFQPVMAAACLLYLGAEDFIAFPSQFDAFKEEYPFYDYAMLHWHEHVIYCSQSTPGTEIEDLAKVFLESEQALGWLEAILEHPSFDYGRLMVLQAQIANASLTISADIVGDILEKSLRKNLLENDGKIIASTFALGRWYLVQSRFNEAEEVFAQLSQAFTKSGSIESQCTLAAMAELAHTFKSQGQLDQAERLGLQLVEPMERILGIGHPGTISAMTDLASVHRAKGLLKDAKKRELYLLQKASETLGSNHPVTLNVMHNLATTYLLMGNWNGAEGILVQAVETMTIVSGPEHPNTLTALDSLASVYDEQGRWREAEALYVQVVEGKKRTLGLGHSSTQLSKNNLALVCVKLGLFNEAEVLVKEALAVIKKNLGTEHSDTLKCMGNPAEIYSESGRLTKAQEMQSELVAIAKRVLGSEHPHTLSLTYNLGCTQMKLERPEDARQLLSQVYKVRARVLGLQHPSTLTAMSSLAYVYLKLGQLPAAEGLQLRALEMKKKNLGRDHPSTLGSMRNLQHIYTKLGKAKEAVDLGVAIVETTKRVSGAEHPETLESMGGLAAMYINDGRLSEAEQLQHQVYDIRVHVLGPEHLETLSSMCRLASTYTRQHKFVEAGLLQLRVMEGRKLVLGETARETLESTEVLAATYAAQARYREAEVLGTRVVEIRKRVLGEGHPDTVKSIERLEVLRDLMKLLDDVRFGLSLI